MRIAFLLSCVTSGAALCDPVTTSAQKSAVPAAVAEVVVTGDRVRLIETKPSHGVFGLDKPLVETPRSATIVNDTTMIATASPTSII